MWHGQINGGPWLARMRRARGTRAGTAAACALAVLVAGCGAGQPPGVPTPASGAPMPAGVSVLRSAPLPPGTVGTPQNCDLPDSLRPSGPLPPPGHMPAGSAMATIFKNKYLRVGVDQTTYLDGYRDPRTGQLQGFDIDVAQQIAQAIFGNPDAIQFKAITQNQRIPMIESGAVDIVADSMTITCDRKKHVAFSTDYFNAGEQVLVPSDSTVTGIGDLGGKKVCAAAGTTSIQVIAAEPSHPVPVAVNNWTDCLVMLEQGQVAAISTDNSILAGLEAQDPQTKLVGPLFTSEQHGIAMSRNAPDLVRFVNAVLERMRTDGEWTKLYKKWFGTRLEPRVPAPPAPSYTG
jgi:polar amino acid transport system substrate-binding protein